MKKIINNITYGFLYIPLVAMFFFTGAVCAQNSLQNKSQKNSKTERFIDKDTNKDGFISQNEYQSSSFDEFDTDQNGKLSRNEFRANNRSSKRNSMGNAKLGKNRSKGINQGNGRGNGECKINKRNKNLANGPGICPYGKQRPTRTIKAGKRGRRVG